MEVLTQGLGNIGHRGQKPRRKIGAVRVQGLGGRGMERMAEKQDGILPGKNTGVGFHCLLEGIVTIQ